VRILASPFATDHGHLAETCLQISNPLCLHKTGESFDQKRNTRILTLRSFRAYLFNPPKFKIVVGDYSWVVHENILTDKSNFFRVMCSGKFKEAQTNEVTLHDGPLQVAQMIMWLYYGVYDTRRAQDLKNRVSVSLNDLLEAGLAPSSAGGALESLFDSVGYEDNLDWDIKSHLEMYKMADKYDINRLSSFCLEQIFNHLNMSDSKRTCLVVDFVESTDLDTTELKRRLRDYFVAHVHHVRDDARFDQFLKRDTNLAFEILKGPARRL
jgi:BTB/POZ domain